MTHALHLQQTGRVLRRGRIVHAQRARKLRRLGEDVRFAGYSDTGRAMYRWQKRAIVLDYAPDITRLRSMAIAEKRQQYGAQLGCAREVRARRSK